MAAALKVNYIIIGQGICGTLLSYCLMKAGKKVMVIDNGYASSASRVAGGIINPVTGRRVVTTWKVDELFPLAENMYNEVEKELNYNIIQKQEILAFTSSTDMLQSYEKRIQEGNVYIHASEKKELIAGFFDFPFNVVSIYPSYIINIQSLIAIYKQKLIQSNCLLHDDFNEEKLQVYDSIVQYKNIQAETIIYCNGMETFKSKYWQQLPYVANKGEALIAEIPNLPADVSYKFGRLTFIPWQQNLWWIGSSNELEFESAEPTESFKLKTEAALKAILKIPFTVKQHLAGIRPATVERRPFVGAHPLNKNVCILNGMGSKGCSIAPWAAQQLSNHLLHNKSLDKEIDVQRFQKLLSRL